MPTRALPERWSSRSSPTPRSAPWGGTPPRSHFRCGQAACTALLTSSGIPNVCQQQKPTPTSGPSQTMAKHQTYEASMSSPRKMVLSLEPDPTIGSLGWNATSFTLPLWPGSLYSSLRDDASQMYTLRSDDPAVTCCPSADHAQRSSSRSKVWAWPARALGSVGEV